MRLFIVLLVLTLSLPTVAITWCHDFTLYKVTNKDHNSSSPAKLRKTLRQLDYKRFPVSPGTETSEVAKRLKRGDVLIFGEKHSGFVLGPDKIEHYTQEAGKVGKVYSPSEATKKPGYRRGSLAEIRNFRRTNEAGVAFWPYKDVTIEIWRPQLPDLDGKWQTNHGKALVAGSGFQYEGFVDYPNGNRGTFRGKIVLKNEGKFYQGTWRNDADSGTFSVSIDKGGKSMKGTWKNTKGQSGPWTFQKQ